MLSRRLTTFIPFALMAVGACGGGEADPERDQNLPPAEAIAATTRATALTALEIPKLSAKLLGPTPAMERGMLDRRLTAADVLSNRIFIGHIELPDSWRRYYGRLVSTRALSHNRRHTLKYAA